MSFFAEPHKFVTVFVDVVKKVSCGLRGVEERCKIDGGARRIISGAVQVVRVWQDRFMDVGV